MIERISRIRIDFEFTGIYAEYPFSTFREIEERVPNLLKDLKIELLDFMSFGGNAACSPYIQVEIPHSYHSDIHVEFRLKHLISSFGRLDQS